MHRGVAVRFMPGAGVYWEGLDEAIDAMYLLDYRGKELVDRIMLEVYPEDAKLQVVEREVNGTLWIQRSGFELPRIFIAIRKIPGRNACYSALHHEFAEHAIPQILDKNANSDHDMTLQTLLTFRMTTACLDLVSQKPISVGSD